MLRRWTIGRASGVGIVAGLGALALALVQDNHAEPLFWVLLVAAFVAGLSGLSILLITIVDLAVHPRRSRRLLPVRAFDVALGLLLVVIAFFQLRALLGQLPA